MVSHQGRQTRQAEEGPPANRIDGQPVRPGVALRPVATSAAEGRRRLLRRTAQALFIVAIVILGVVAVARQWPDVRASIGRLSPLSLVISFLAVLAGLVASMSTWRVVLADLGSPLPTATVSRIFFIGQLGKYLPGAVWPVLAQMELARGHGVPRRRTGTASGVTLLVSLVAGVALAALTLPLAASDAIGRFRWIFLIAPLMAAALHPRVLNPAVRLLFKVARREPPERPLSWRGLSKALLCALVAWSFLGLQIAVLGIDLGLEPARATVLSIGAFALAFIAGLLVTALLVVAPAGAGSREVALVALLAPAVGHGEAIVVALVSRLLMTVADLVAAGAATATYARRRSADWEKRR